MAASFLISLSSSSPWLCKTKTTARITTTIPLVFSTLPSSILFHYIKLSCFLPLSVPPFSPFSQLSSSLLCSTITNNNNNKQKKNKLSTVLALVEDQQFAATAPASDVNIEDGSAFKNLIRPCELYACNLPRSCDISQILDMFKPYGTVQSVEVSRNAETGVSRGSGYVTMSSIDEAKAAIAALDGSDVDGREMRVTFSADMNTGGRNIQALNATPNRNLIFESPYKVYAGNLAWSVKPEDLRNLFCQFGTVVSARVLHDRKGGKNRVYGFLSFSSPAELEAAMSLNGTEYRSRKLLLREVVKQNEP